MSESTMKVRMVEPTEDPGRAPGPGSVSAEPVEVETPTLDDGVDLAIRIAEHEDG